MSDDQKQSQLYESVSALVDNQASPLELQRILAHTEKSTGVRARWHRYHLARAALCGEAKGVSYNFADISDGVRAAIAELNIDHCVVDRDGEEAAVSTPQVVAKTLNKRQLPTWLMPFGKVAVAASVTLAVVLAAQYLPVGDTATVDGELAQSNSAYQPTDFSALSGLNVQNVSSASFPSPAETRAQAAYDFQVQQRQQWEEEQVRQAIHRLMLEHAQQSSLDQSAGLMPFIRVSDKAIVTEVSQ